MQHLSEIPVHVEGPPEPGRGLGGGVTAILHEIATLLERLSRDGESGAVDLGTMPMSTSDYEQLRSALGEGEVDAVIRAEGPSRVRETGIHGVWWIEHRDADEQMLAEYLEVTVVPAILQAPKADIASGLERIRQHLAAGHDEDNDKGSSPGGNEHAD